MTSSVLMVIVLALLVYGLERNHYRQQRRRPRGARELRGSTDVEDRDLTRIEADLRAIPTRAPHRARARRTDLARSARPVVGLCGRDG
ncbi:MAG TPA: hypothetical protein VK735_13600 [Pseudonocardia sp.]|uniref:hypothetical protein n=1 Tax=Pseudonocardia sp. TaxID=60912 RepID=UPI002BDA8448|nr:hypothetical protein [Pseudonocardia sp.]HTF48479.1 hypothetical protein [Pseudonocardia sp.]